jgi:polyisoprenoid-binding protein YceI
MRAPATKTSRRTPALRPFAIEVLAMKSLFLLPFAFTLFALPAPRDASPVPAGEHDWTVDTVHSGVAFRIKHANASWFMGMFEVVKGNVTLDPKAPETGSVQLTIPVDSIDTNDKKRDEHLRGPDFFNAKENPEITFKSTKIAKKGEMLQVTGDLSIHGKTKATTIDVEHIGDAEMFGKRRGYSTKFTIKRSDFDMHYGTENKSLGDEVTLMIDLELVQPEKK